MVKGQHSPREPWFVPLGLLVLGGIGVMYHQWLLWGWRLGGVGPVDRRTFGGALFLLLCGGLLAWGEGRGLRLLRRLCLCAIFGGAAFLHWYWRAVSADATWGWIAMLGAGLCGGGEIGWLVRSLGWLDVPANGANLRPIRLQWVCLWLLSLIVPSMCLPYLGVLPGCLMYACVITTWTLWGLWYEDEATPTHRRAPRLLLSSLFGFVCAASLGVLLATPGISMSGKGYLPVDRDPTGLLTLETSRRVDTLWIRGGWYGPYRWELLSSDAHRWAEGLVHPAMADSPPGAHVLLLGGEDGLALREILRYPGVAQVQVWSDRAQRLDWFRTQPLLQRMVGHAFQDRRVRLRRFAHRDAMFRALQQGGSRYQRIFLALDRPWRGTLHMTRMSSLFRTLATRLSPNGRLACWWGELHPPRRYACMLQSMRQEGWKVQPYRSMGTGITWGLVLASRHAKASVVAMSLAPGLRYLQPQRLQTLFKFPPDEDPARVHTKHCDD